MNRPLEITPLELPLASLSSSLVPLGTPERRRAAHEASWISSGLDAGDDPCHARIA